jgi:Carboxypeptidase regulatory-like domain
VIFWARGQASTAGVNGIVTDSSVAAVSGATIAAVDTSKRTQKTPETDAQGRYTIINLQPGNYDVDVELGAKVLLRRCDEVKSCWLDRPSQSTSYCK